MEICFYFIKFINLALMFKSKYNNNVHDFFNKIYYYLFLTFLVYFIKKHTKNKEHKNLLKKLFLLAIMLL